MWMWTVIGLNILTMVHGFSNGNFPQSCTSMLPVHLDNNNKQIPPQNTEAPFEVRTLPVSRGEPITVFLKSKTSVAFRGFMLEAQKNKDRPVGRFILLDTSFGQLLGCNGSADSAVSNNNNLDKTSISVNWTAQGENSDIVFRATFLQTFSRYWTSVISTPLPQTTSTTTPSTSTRTTTLNTTTSATTTTATQSATASTTTPNTSTSSTMASTKTSNRTPSTTSITTPSTTTSTITPSTSKRTTTLNTTTTSTTTTTATQSATASTTTPNTSTSSTMASTKTSNRTPSTTSITTPSTTTSTITPSTSKRTTTLNTTTTTATQSATSTITSNMSTSSTTPSTTTSTTEPSLLSIASTASSTSPTGQVSRPIRRDTQRAGITMTSFDCVFVVMKMGLYNIDNTLTNSPVFHPLNKGLIILCGVLCAATEIAALVLFNEGDSNKVTLVALVCVVLVINFIELVIVSVPWGPSLELKKMCNLAVKVCSVIHVVFTIAVTFIGVYETDNCSKNIEESWLIKVMAADTAWIFLSIIWVFVASIQSQTTVGRHTTGGSQNSEEFTLQGLTQQRSTQQRKKKQLTAAKATVVGVSAIISVGAMAFNIAIIVGIFGCSEK
uniref:filamentous growth regulator 23-like n=1 Tax=Monopterus albus TaxID=43700 RepID=UPI0009B4B1CB|nr:filamentous growth regulator 23-like [Monopterus albus]